MMARLSIGDIAPEITLIDAMGTPLSLAQIRRQRRTLISFVRQFGCVFCRTELARLARLRPQIESLDAQLIVITQSHNEETCAFCAEHAPGVDCYSDIAHGGGYRAFGLQRGHLSQLFGPAVWIQMVRTSATAGGKPVDDAALLPGIFVLNPDGRVHFAWYSRHIGDYPTNELLLDALRVP